jgi:hypothetical protein
MRFTIARAARWAFLTLALTTRAFDGVQAVEFDASGTFDGVVSGDGNAFVSDDVQPSPVADGDLGIVPMPGQFDGSPIPYVDQCSPACPQGECDACRPPYGAVNRLIDNKEACWTLRVDGVLLWRNSPRQQPLYQNIRTESPALDAHQINSTPAGGPLFSLFRTNGCGEALEATYFRAANFRGIDTLPPLADGYAPIYAPAVPFDTARANLGSSIQSFELNGRTTIGSNMQLLGGFRWVEWNESLSLVGTSTSGVLPYQDNVAIGCVNSLYGYQIGFDSLLLTTSWLRVEALMKGGAYYNNAVSSTSAFTQDVGIYSNRLTSPHGAAFVGEIGMTGVIALHRNIDFRFGYMGLWLESLAQPTNQYAQQTFDPSQPAPRLDLTGGVVLQGVRLGLEGRW